jgi:hypothetical protein
MRSLFILISMSLLLSNCKGQTKTEDQTLNNKMMDTTTQKNNLYMFDIEAKCVFDLYVNGIPAVINSDPCGDVIEINDFVLENGIYKIKAVFYTDPTQNQNIDKTTFNIYSALKINGEKKGGLKLIKNLPIPTLVSTKPTTIVQEWEVELTDLPYTLKGWSKSKIFKEKDSLEIKPKVVAFYEKLRTLLNEGNGEVYINKTKRCDQDMIVYGYVNEDAIKKANENQIKGIPKYAKNNMLPLEDYDLKIYAKGQLVCLERKGNIKINSQDPKYQTPKEMIEGVNSIKQIDPRGWSPLILNAPNYTRDFHVLLHMPENSNEFEIIR